MGKTWRWGKKRRRRLGRRLAKQLADAALAHVVHTVVAPRLNAISHVRAPELALFDLRRSPWEKPAPEVHGAWSAIPIGHPARRWDVR